MTTVFAILYYPFDKENKHYTHHGGEKKWKHSWTPTKGLHITKITHKGRTAKVPVIQEWRVLIRLSCNIWLRIVCNICGATACKYKLSTQRQWQDRLVNRGHPLTTKAQGKWAKSRSMLPYHLPAIDTKIRTWFQQHTHPTLKFYSSYWQYHTNKMSG